MYQTVGQDAIELVACALDVPLYRRVIAGQALQQGAEYGARDPGRSGGTDGDETEDMLHLLATVKVSRMPSPSWRGPDLLRSTGEPSGHRRRVCGRYPLELSARPRGACVSALAVIYP